MSLKEWAENEVKIACKNELGGRELQEGEWDYGCACYESALKAYNSLLEDDHSIYSWNVTKNILIRLMNGQPLTPITEEDFTVNVTSISENPELINKKGYETIQCSRMSSLFMDKYFDGTIKYSDVDRVIGKSIRTGYTYDSGRVRAIVDEMFPITLPYNPDVNPYVVYTDDFLYDKRNGDFDTLGVFYITTPNGEKIEYNKFYKESSSGWEEITKEEYDMRFENKIK